MEDILESSAQQTGVQEISRFRQTLPQVIATSANVLLFLSLGMMIGFPAILIPVLTDKNNDSQPHFTINEASWYVSLSYVFQPIGSILGGTFLQSLGCKRMMILLNIPQFGCWLTQYFAASNVVLYISHALVGCVLGLMEGPGLRYVIEISHPSVRGILTTCTTLFISLGFLFIIFLGSLTDWRNAALIGSAVPLLCILVLSQIPETPMWLMSKGRPRAALKSLQWLRGWTTAEMVRDEFAKLEFYARKKTVTILHGYGKKVDTADEEGNGTTNQHISTENCDVGRIEASGRTATNGRLRVSFQIEEKYVKRVLADKWRDVIRREMIMPLSKCCTLFVVFCFGGMPPLRPYLVKIFSELNLPVQASWSSVLVALMGILGNIGCMLLIKRVGKKPLLIFSLSCSALCLISLALSFMGYIPVAEDSNINRWCPLILFLALFFFYNVGLHPITWQYLGELLPYRGRGIGTGIGVSFYYLVTFVAVKTFSTLVQELKLQGVFLLYAAVCIGGVFFTYFLPETEGRYLSDIETEITGGTNSYRNK